MKRELKKILIVLITTIISMALHSMLPLEPIPPDRLSIVAEKLSFVGTATLFFIVTYYIIATVYLKYESILNGSKIVRGIKFGSLVGMIWWVGMIEGMFALGSTFFEEFMMGLLDFIPILILCIFLSIFMVEEKNASKKRINFKKSIFDIIVFSFIFVAGRLIRYYGSDVGYDLENMGALTIWTIAFAITISINYIFFKNPYEKFSLLKSSFTFTFVIFGLHYMMFVYFIPLIFKGMFRDLTIILIYDLVLVFLASLASYKLEVSTSLKEEKRITNG